MKENHIEKLDLQIGDSVYYISNEKEPWKSTRGHYIMQGIKKDQWLARFDGSVKVTKRFEELRVPQDITLKNQQKFGRRRAKI